jgi:hypothetical protein
MWREARRKLFSIVMRGLDPRIHLKKRFIQANGLPGQARQ